MSDAKKTIKHTAMYEEIERLSNSLNSLNNLVNRVETDEQTPKSRSTEDAPVPSLSHLLQDGAEQIAKLNNQLLTSIERLEGLLF